MIQDHTIGSPRPEGDRNYIGRGIIGNSLTSLLVSILVLASLTNLAVEAWSEGAASSMLARLQIPGPDAAPLDEVKYVRTHPEERHDDGAEY